MAEDNGCELRGVAWSQALPFVRLFATLRLSLGVNRLLLGLACVLLCYVGGRILDGIWGARHGVVVSRAAGLTQSEIQAYAQGSQTEFDTWRHDAREAAERAGIVAILQARKATGTDDARKLLTTKSLRDILVDADFKQELRDQGKLVNDLEKTGRANIKNDKELGSAEKQRRQTELIDAADTVRRMLGGTVGVGDAAALNAVKSVELVAAVDPANRAKNQVELAEATTRMSQLREYEQLKPRAQDPRERSVRMVGKSRRARAPEAEDAEGLGVLLARKILKSEPRHVGAHRWREVALADFRIRDVAVDALADGAVEERLRPGDPGQAEDSFEEGEQEERGEDEHGPEEDALASDGARGRGHGRLLRKCGVTRGNPLGAACREDREVLAADPRPYRRAAPTRSPSPKLTTARPPGPLLP